MSVQGQIYSTSRPGRDGFRVGLFGGTFDPVHVGHLHVAEEVKEAFGLETIYVIPAAAPPHKTWKAVSPPNDRLNMARLCFDEKPGFQVSDVEVKRQGLSFTIDTVNHFLSRRYTAQGLLLMVGTDAFYEIHTWRSYKDILEQVPLVVIVRPNMDDAANEFPVDRMSRYLGDHVTKGYRWDQSRGAFYHDQAKPIYLFKGSLWHVSSTDIRQRLKNKEPVSSMMTKTVYDYIVEKGLYP